MTEALGPPADHLFINLFSDDGVFSYFYIHFDRCRSCFFSSLLNAFQFFSGISMATKTEAILKTKSIALLVFYSILFIGVFGMVWKQPIIRK